MSEKKQLNEEQLQQVSGGAILYTKGDIGKYENEYRIPVDMYAGVIGTKYLYKQTGTDHWLFGELYNTYEHKVIGNITKRYHDVIVEDGYGVGAEGSDPTKLTINYGGTKEILASKFQMYRKD